jgi:hypothetical protein
VDQLNCCPFVGLGRNWPPIENALFLYPFQSSAYFLFGSAALSFGVALQPFSLVLWLR